MAQPLGASGIISTQNLNTGSGVPTALSFVQLGLEPAGSSIPNATPGPALDSSTSVITVQVSGTYTGALTARGSSDGNIWTALGPAPFVNAATGLATATIASGVTGLFYVYVTPGLQAIRIDAEAAVTGAATVSVNASTAVVVTPAPLGLTGNASTTVAAATGTAIKAAAGLMVKVVVNTSGSAATPIYDNASAASGTILFTVPATPTVGTVYTVNVPAANGMYAGATNTSGITVYFY